MTSLLSQSVCQRAAERNVCALVTKTMQRYSRLGNYGHNAGLSCKSSLKQKHTRAEDNNYPSRIMRRLDAQSRLSKHIDDRNGGALRLQGVNEICLDPVMMTMVLQKPDWRVTTALIWMLWHVSANVLMCQSASYTVFHVYLCSWSSSELTDAVVSVVCVSPGNVTDRVLRETDLVSPSGLHAANGVCQSSPWQLLVPPTVSVYPEASEKYVLMDQSLKSARAEAGCRNSYWIKKKKTPQKV